MDRKRSVPPIESISAPIAPARRGRSRATRGTRGTLTKPRKPAQRRVVPPLIVTAASRPVKTPRRHHLAFGCKLPEIICRDDSYDFELPAEIKDKQDPLAEGSQVEGSQAEGSQAEDSDGSEQEPDTDGDRPDVEPEDNPAVEEDSEGGFDGTET